MEELSIYGGFKKRGAVFYRRCCVAEKMRREGATYDEIAGKIGRSRATAIHYVRRYMEVKQEPRRDKAFSDFIADFEKSQEKQAAERVEAFPEMDRKEAFAVACELLKNASNRCGEVADMSLYAAIINAQADKDTAKIVNMLDDLQVFIGKLKKIISE